MSRSATLLAAFALVFSLALQASAHAVITRLADRTQISLPQLAAAADSSDVILVGESHTTKTHHDLQLDLIRLLEARNRRLAIGLEMMEATYQPQLDEWVKGEMPESVMKGVFERNWSDWELYKPIFLLARDHHIPMIALNVPAQIVEKVSRHGFASLSVQEKQGLPEGTSCDFRNPQIQMLKKAFAFHGHKGEGQVFSYFCEAQTVRNSGMALRMAAYLKKHPGHKVVTLTGIWHAEKHAIPEALERTGKHLSYTVILPETEALSSANCSEEEADYLVDL